MNKQKKPEFNFKDKKYSIQSSARSQSETLYTSIDPVTERCFSSRSKRYLFNRKYERTHLPLLVIRYEGIIGVFEKEDGNISSEN